MKIFQNAMKAVNSVATNAILAFVLAKAGVSMGYAKLKEKAQAANMTLKEYVGNEENIGHISLVFYDILPLTFKLGLRYEKFHEEFALRFKTIRNWIYKYDDEQTASAESKSEVKNDEAPKEVPEAVKTETAAPAEKKPRVRKPVEKKVDGAVSEDKPKKPATKRVAVKKPAVKKVVVSETASVEKVKKPRTKKEVKPEGDGA